MSFTYRTLLIVMSGSLICGTTAAQTERSPITVAYDFCYTRGGDVFGKALDNIASKEGQILMKAGCNLFGVDCSQQVAVGAKIIEATRPNPGQDENSGAIKVVAPGYELCTAYMAYGSASITSETVFNSRIMPKELRYTVYAMTHGGLNAGVREWVNARLYLIAVPEDERKHYQCAAIGTYPWLCKGTTCTPKAGYDSLHPPEEFTVKAPVFDGCRQKAPPSGGERPSNRRIPQ